MSAAIPERHALALLEQEMADYRRRHPASARLHARALASMPEGVPSGVISQAPFPLSIVSGHGAWVRDRDGRAFVDYHNGFGVTVYGHGNPLILEAQLRVLRAGPHFGALGEDVPAWAEALSERFGLHGLRFSCSGSEAVNDALRLARAWTKRDVIVKIEGAYHGSGAEALISNNMVDLPRRLSVGSLPRPRPASQGLPASLVRHVRPIPFNDLESARRALADERAAALLVEPILFNCGAIFPLRGYLEGLRRLCRETGTLLIFDEVKTGLTVAYGGAMRRFDVRPDLVVLGKGIGGGVPASAVGDCRGDLFDLVEEWEVPLLGTFSGHALAAAGGAAALDAVLKPSVYEEILEPHGRELRDGLEDLIAEHELPAYAVAAGAKGCLIWADGPALRDYRDYCRRFNRLLAELTWFWLLNRGVLLPPGHDEQWTHGVAHGRREAGRFLEAFADLAAALRFRKKPRSRT